MDSELTPFQSFAISLWALLCKLICRTLDAVFLLIRPPLIRTYAGLWLAEWRRSPYRWPRAFEAVRTLQQAGQTAREAMYGEAPLFTAVWIFRRSGMTDQSSLLDLGAGRGLPLLAARWLGARARGVELLPSHVESTAALLAKAGAVLEAGNAQTVEMGEATHVFLNWVGMSPETRAKVVERVVTARPGARFLAVSIPVEHARVKTIFSTRAFFTWGLARVYVQELSPC